MPALRWQPITTLLLAVYGLGASIYLTITHFEPKALACVSNATIQLREGHPEPPVRDLRDPGGHAWPGCSSCPCWSCACPPLWRSAHRWVHLARLVLSITGVGMIIYLISAELFVIKAICLWCSSVHLVTFALFVVIATASPIVLAPGYGASDPDPAPGGRRPALSPGRHVPWLRDAPGRPARLAWGAVAVILVGVIGLVVYALTHQASPERAGAAGRHLARGPRHPVVGADRHVRRRRAPMRRTPS